MRSLINKALEQPIYDKYKRHKDVTMKDPGIEVVLHPLRTKYI